MNCDAINENNEENSSGETTEELGGRNRKIEEYS